MKIKSTPRSCNQKKSSVYKSSKSSSSRTIGISIGSGCRLKATIVPLINCDIITNKMQKPNTAEVKW